MNATLRYSEIKSQIDKLTVEAKELLPEVSESIVKILEESGEKTYSNEFGSFKIRASKTVTYSEDYQKREGEVKTRIEPLQATIDELNTELKDKAKQEEKDGVAKVEVTSQSAVFTSNKE